MIPFADSAELVMNSGLPAAALIEVGTDHRLADNELLAAMLRECGDEGEGCRVPAITHLHAVEWPGTKIVRNMT